MLDPELAHFLRLVVGRTDRSLIKDTILLEEGCVIDVRTPVVVFVLRPDPALIRNVARLVNENDEDTKFHAFFCPQFTTMAKQLLEEARILKCIQVHEMPYELIPLETDLLSMEDNLCLRNLLLGYSYVSLTMVKRSLQRLEALYGKIPLKFAKGAWSSIIYDSMEGKTKSSGKEGEATEIDALIMIDRTVDLFTPLMTQMTYEGVIDELYGIKCGCIEVANKVVDPESKESEGWMMVDEDVKDPDGKRTLVLNSQEDIMFGECRDFGFNAMKDHFPKKYEEMKVMCEKKDSYKTVAEMTDYMKRLRGFKIPQLLSCFNLSSSFAYHAL